MKINKVLIIRFSSFGDIIQCTGVIIPLKKKFPDAKIDWVTKSEFKNLLEQNQGINHVWDYSKESGLLGFLQLAFLLRKQNYDTVYDAHNNLRSKILFLILRFRPFASPYWITRSKDRFKRILLFWLRINLFPKPFKGINSYIDPFRKFKSSNIRLDLNAPLVEWEFKQELKGEIGDLLQSQKTIVIVPFAAWKMKCWPLDRWKELILLLHDFKIVVLGGKGDFLDAENLVQVAPKQVVNLAGKLSLIESCQVIYHSSLVISADTGLLHVADVLQKKAIALMGPSAFGFTVSSTVKTLEVQLACRPCSKDGRGNCSQKVYQKCMVDITAAQVFQLVLDLI